MARRVDEIKLVQLAGDRLEPQGHTLRFDGDAALSLQIHGVENLGLHLARIEATAFLNEPIGQRRLAVVDMSDNGKIADILHLRREALAWANQALYRSAMMSEGLIHFFWV